MSPFKSMKGLRGDKLPSLYSLNNCNISFLELFLEFDPFLASCSVSVSPDHLLKFSLVSAHEGEDSGEKGEEIDFLVLVCF